MTVLAEGIPGGFSALYPVFSAMEDTGTVRRGYFIESLGMGGIGVLTLYVIEYVLERFGSETRVFVVSDRGMAAIHGKIVAGRKPAMKFPLRSLSNVRYTPRKGHFEMLGKTKERTLTVSTVKSFAQKHPHKMMKPWPESGSKARVAHMTGKDFFENERSTTVEQPTDVRIEFAAADGSLTVLKEKVALQKDEVVDTSVMNVAALREFFANSEPPR